VSFRIKTIFGIALIQALLLAALITTTIGYQNDAHDRQWVHEATTTATMLATMAQQPLTSNDLTALSRLIHQAMSNRNLVYVRVRNARGQVLAQAGFPEVLEHPFAADHDIDHVQEDVFDAASSIDVDGNHYGRVELGMDVRPLLAAKSEAQNQGFMIAAVEMGLVALLSILLGLYLTRQLTALTRGAEEIAADRAGYQIPVVGDDELARTARAFNKMSRQVAESHAHHKQTEERLRLAASVFTHARESIMITDADANIIEVNDAFTRITGYSREEALGRNPRILQSGRHDPDFYADMWHDLIVEGHWQGEIWNRRRNGEIFAEMLTISEVSDAQDEPQYYVALFTDITTQKEQQKQLEHIAHHDALTGLLNRVLLSDRLNQEMIQSRRRGQKLAVVFLDLDGFKAVNDQHGHEIGDQLLVQIAGRLRQSLREGDTIARLGGDEFVAVMTDLEDASAAMPFLNRILQAVAQPVVVNGESLQVSASLGVTVYPQEEEEVDADQLLRQADQAMYQAKLAGKNRYHVFDPEFDRSVRGHHESLERIRQALEADEFVLYYQPKVNMRTGEVVGAEALIRWQHPDRGLLSPAAFLPLVEDSPLAIDVGDWVFRAALAQMDRWLADGLRVPVSVNVGSRQLQQPEFARYLETLLAAHPAVSPEDLELEVLESSALEDINQVSRVIRECHEVGVSFALDDFGTGYSSLTYLKHLPASTLKIDQSFVRNMLDDPDDLAILEGVLGLTTAFRRRVIAEGMETQAHGEMLLRLGCELAQGYGIARPMPAEDLSTWLGEWQVNPSWLHQPAISRDDQPLLYAAVEHRAWILAIEKYLHGDRNAPPPLNEHQCRFGQWLDDEGARRHGEQPAFQEIKPLHEEVHKVAVALLALRSQGRNEEAQGRLQELHGLRDELQRKLHALLDSQQGR